MKDEVNDDRNLKLNHLIMKEVALMKVLRAPLQYLISATQIVFVRVVPYRQQSKKVISFSVWERIAYLKLISTDYCIKEQCNYYRLID